MPSKETRLNRGVVIAGLMLVAVLLVILGAFIGSRRHSPTADPGTGTVTVPPASPTGTSSSPGPNGSGLLVEPAPSSTTGGHIGPAGIRIGFDQSCTGAVEAATAYTEVGPIYMQVFAPHADPKKAASEIVASNAEHGELELVGAAQSWTPTQKAAFAKSPWVAYPSWGAFRVRSCQPAKIAAIDIWYCLFRTNPTNAPVADPATGPGRECLTTSYALVWESSSWKIQSNDSNSDNDPTTDDFASPDRTPLTVAQRATVVGVVPGWQEYADAPH